MGFNSYLEQVFEKVKIAWDKVVEWIGFIFAWDDILETKNTISSLITAGCDLAANKVGEITTKADNFFASLISDIDNIGVVRDSKELNANSGDGLTSHDIVSSSQNSTSFNWAGERMKNGGAGTSSQIKSTGRYSGSSLTTRVLLTIAKKNPPPKQRRRGSPSSNPPWMA
jgi:hypothetical protein